MKKIEGSNFHCVLTDTIQKTTLLRHKKSVNCILAEYLLGLYNAISYKCGKFPQFLHFRQFYL